MKLVRRILAVLVSVCPLLVAAILLWLFLAHLQGIYNFFVDLVENGIGISIVATPFVFIRRLRKACATVWAFTAALSICSAYLAAVMLYMSWSSGQFNMLAWFLTSGMWPLIYTAVASWSHQGHQFLVEVGLWFGCAVVLGSAAQATLKRVDS